MSEAEEVAAVVPPKRAPVTTPMVHAASLADINEKGQWLIPRICERWETTPYHVIAWLRSALPSNDKRLMCCGDAIGMAHEESGEMGQPSRIEIDFVLSKQGAEGEEECVAIFLWFERWGRSKGARGLYRVIDFADVDNYALRKHFGTMKSQTSRFVLFS